MDAVSATIALKALSPPSPTTGFDEASSLPWLSEEFLYSLLLVYGLCYSRNFPSEFCFPSVLLVILHWVPTISLGECEPMFTSHWANPLS